MPAGRCCGTVSSQSLSDMVVCVVGGGIVGVSTAYFLAKSGISVTLIEATEIACAASGKAGGFLARGWGDGSPTEQLHHLGFDLHHTLASELGVPSYRKVPTLSVSGRRRTKAGTGPSWLQLSSSDMGPDTAQVSPHELTRKLMHHAVEMGVTHVTAHVSGVIRRENGDVAAITCRDGSQIECDRVVFAMGPWTCQIEQWFDLSVPMTGVKSTSMVFADVPAVAAEPHALFCEEDSNACHLEVYPRPNGEVYVCGLGGSDHVKPPRLMPDGDCGSAASITPNSPRTTAAMSSLQTIAPVIPQCTDVLHQACMRPMLPDGLPMIGPIPGTANGFVAAGHNCWGILWGPVTGQIMAQLLTSQPPLCDIAAFDPARFMTPARNRGRQRKGKGVGEQW